MKLETVICVMGRSDEHRIAISDGKVRNADSHGRRVRYAKRLLLTSASVVALAMAEPQSIHAQNFQPLGVLSPGNTSVAYAVSADGSTVVGYSNPGAYQAFRWTAATGMLGLGFVPGDTTSQAVGVNADGTVVVGTGNLQAFRWTPVTGMVGLGAFGGGINSQAFAVNADGTVVVGEGNICTPTGPNSCTGSIEAFRWTSATGMVGLGQLPGGTTSQAHGVSADGAVVVGAADNGVTGEAFRWTAATGMVGLGQLSGGTDSQAHGVSADGAVVVGAAGHGGTGEAFRWTAGTGMVGLGFLPGSQYSDATAVNSNGSVVVGYNFDAGGVARAFRWTAATGMQSITDILIANGDIPANWRLTFAWGVSADGTTIVGEGVLPGTGEAWVARIPVNAFALLDLQGSNHAIGSLVWGGIVTNTGASPATLTVGSDNTDSTFKGTIQDGASTTALTKVGSGTQTLTGQNTYSGDTNINSGKLVVDGAITASAVFVNNGGILSGTGTVGNSTINSGGTFAPGSGLPGSTMTVVGNLAFQSGALYLAQIDPSNSSRAAVTGTAFLGGTVEALFAPGSYLARDYTILSATGGFRGTTFSNLVSNVSPNFAVSLSYTDTEVLLNLTAGLGRSLGLNQNQQNVAGAIDKFFNNGGTLPPNFLALFGLTGPALTSALTILSGETATGSQRGAFQLMSQFLSLGIDAFVDGVENTSVVGVTRFAPERQPLPDDVTLAYAKVLNETIYKAPIATSSTMDQRWSVWGSAYGGYNRTSGDPAVIGTHDLAGRTGGFATGLDYRVAPGTIFGFALAGGGTGWGLAEGLGTGHSDAFQAGIYGFTRSGPVYVGTSAAFTNYWMSTDRTSFAGDRLTASFNAQSFGVRVEGGYRSVTASGTITPYAALQGQSFHTPTYSETDLNGGGFGLSYNARNAKAMRSELGARYDRVMRFDYSTALAIRGRVAWAHDWVSDPALNPTFQTLPGANFIVNGATPAKNMMLASTGAELRFSNGIALLGKLDGEFSNRSQTYAGTGTLRVIW